MDKKSWKAFAVCLLIPLAVGLIAALLTPESQNFYGSGVEKPALAPPGWLFPVVWTVLYLLMGTALWLVWKQKDDPARGNAFLAFGVQLILNFFWPLLFFGAKAFGAAFAWLCALLVAVVWTAVVFGKIDRRAGWLFVPYIVWCCFALYLNGAVAFS